MIIEISLFIDQSRYCCDKILLAMLCTFYRLNKVHYLLISVREYRRDNQKGTHNVDKTKQKHNTIIRWTPLYGGKYK